MILIGAQKCRGCKRWTHIEPDPSGLRMGRILVGVLLVVVSVASVWLGNRESPVGDAPPLTPLPAGSSEAVAALDDRLAAPNPAGIGQTSPPRESLPIKWTRGWRIGARAPSAWIPRRWIRCSVPTASRCLWLSRMPPCGSTTFGLGGCGT